MNDKKMGDLISELRKQKNMTQKDLADLLNVTDKAVSKWERGISCPDIAAIPLLAQTLGITSEELLNIQRAEVPASAKKPLKKMRTLIPFILTAVGLAMGIATLVNSILEKADVHSAVTTLSVGLTCISLVLLMNRHDSQEKP
jgi:transcriptional regulator with XRE-family HTH domain